MEIWDAYDRFGNLLGYDLIRGNSIEKGVFHLATQVLVRHKDGSILCMKRSLNKEKFPGLYEATAGGSALKGEDKMACIKRELKEETGLISDNFIEVDKIVSDESNCIFYAFVCTVDIVDKNSIFLQEGETIGYKWFSEDEFVSLLNTKDIIPAQVRRFNKYFKEQGWIK